MNKNNNLIIPFTICDDFVRGRIIKLDSELSEIISQNNYPEPVNRVLAEMLLISAMLGSQFKEEIILSIQLQDSEFLKYVIVDYRSPGLVRGYAQLDNQVDYTKVKYTDLIRDSILSVTIDRKLTNSQRYQGIIKIEADSLAKAMEEYFFQSEQIKTSIKLSFGNLLIPGKKKLFCGGGIMIQQMPDDVDQQHWQEAQIFFNTIYEDELIDPEILVEKLLYSLYHELGVKIFDYIAIEHKCNCSREKAENIILSIGKDEAMNSLIRDVIEIDCQFCNKSQKFTIEDIENLYNKE